MDQRRPHSTNLYNPPTLQALGSAPYPASTLH